MKQVEFYYDLVSPYSYLARPEIERICREQGAELVLRPALLGGVHRLSKNHAPVETPLKARYQMKDIHRWAARYSLPLRFPRPFPFRTITTMRAAIFCEERGKLEDFTREAFKFYWEEGGAPDGLEADESGPVREVARRVDLDPDEVLEGASAQEVKEKLKRYTEKAVERGVFGMPAFFVGEQLYWGNDRLPFVEEALEKVQPKARTGR